MEDGRGWDGGDAVRRGLVQILIPGQIQKVGKMGLAATTCHDHNRTQEDMTFWADPLTRYLLLSNSCLSKAQKSYPSTHSPPLISTQMIPYTPPLRPMLLHTQTKSRPCLRVVIRPVDRLARKHFTLRIAKDIEGVESKRGATPIDAHVVADGRECDTVVVVHLGPGPD